MDTKLKKCGIYKTYPKKEGDVEGGLRLQGIYKEGNDEYPLITYVTVVYNRATTIMDCMQSVWKQEYPNIEYIIVDGASTDGTKEIIEANADKIDYFISQPDNGIYSAMNKGIKLAKGDFICFMNSDDQCTERAAEIVIEKYRKSRADILCGSRKLVQNGKILFEEKYSRYPIKKSVFRYVQMFHQSTYASRKVFDVVGYFKEKYSLLADWVWEATAIDKGFKIVFFEEELAKFSYDGASCKGVYKRDTEWELWACELFPFLPQKDAAYFIYSLDRGRHPLYSLHTLNKEAFKYFKYSDFAKTYFETVLYSCLEECKDIITLENGKSGTSKVSLKNESFNIVQLYNHLEKMLVQSCNRQYGIQDCEELRLQLVELENVKKKLNRDIYCLYVKNGKRVGSSKIDYILRVGCNTISMCFSRNTFLSRKFYPIMRYFWCGMFQGRFVEH